jgi:hypothetical protein
MKKFVCGGDFEIKSLQNILKTQFFKFFLNQKYILKIYERLKNNVT